MLSQDAQNLAKSIKEIEAKAIQMAHVLNCIAVNLRSLSESLSYIENNAIVHQPTERPFYEDIKETA